MPLAVAQVVEHDHLVAGVEKFDAGVGTDVAHPASNQYFHCLVSLKKINCKLVPSGFLDQQPDERQVVDKIAAEHAPRFCTMRTNAR